jgi:hypothetical protein
MEKTVKYLSEDLERKFADLVAQVGQKTDRHITELVERVPQMMTAVTTETRLSLNPRLLKASAGKVADELAHGLRGAVQQDLLTWRTVEVAALIKENLSTIQHEIRDDVRDFERSLKDVRLNLTADTGADDLDVDTVITPLLSERSRDAAGADLAWFSAGRALSAAFAGGAGAFAGFVAVSVLGLTAIAPFVVLGGAVLLAVKTASDGDPREAVEQKLRARLQRGVAKNLTEHKEHLVEQVQGDVREHLDGLSREFRSLLLSKVESLREEVRGALEAKNKGAEEVRARRSQINHQLGELDAINHRLDTIVDRVVALDEDLRGRHEPVVADPPEEDEDALLGW